MTRPPFNPFNRDDLYILDEHHRPVPCRNILEQAEWLTDERRRVRQTTTDHHWISTVFLGVDHNHLRNGPPILFETMVFDREGHPSTLLPGLTVRDDYEQRRYATWDDAITGHEATVRRWRKMEADARATASEVSKLVDTLGTKASDKANKAKEENGK